MMYFLGGVCDGEQHPPLPCDGFSDDCDGEVVEEGVGNEGLGEAAHVGVGAEAVGGVTLKAQDEGNRGRQGDADQLCQV